MKKGFTLIELLAVIVILAIIMVIAVPRIMDIIQDSKQSAWTDNVKLIVRTVEIDYYNDSFNAVTSSTNCTQSNLTNFRNKIKKIADYDEESTEINNPNFDLSNGKCTFEIKGKSSGKFSGFSKTITCEGGKCSY